MGLIKIRENISDNYIYSDFNNGNILIKSGIYRKGKDNNVVDGASILIDQDQFLILVSDNKVIDFSGVPGLYVFDYKAKPILEIGNYYSKTQLDVKVITNSNIYAYFINTKDLDNKFGTVNPIIFKDNKLGITIKLRCYGTYGINVVDPIALFLSNIEDNIALDLDFEEVFLNRFIQAMEGVFAKIALQGVSYDNLTQSGNKITLDVNDYLYSVLNNYGLQVSYVTLASVTPTDDSAIEIVNAKNIIKEDTREQLENTTVITPNVFEEETKVLCPNCGTLIEGNFCIECGTKKPE